MKKDNLHIIFIILLLIWCGCKSTNKRAYDIPLIKEPTTFEAKYLLAQSYMFKNEKKIRKLVGKIDKSLRYANYQLIYLPNFKINNPCFLNNNCMYDGDFISCLDWNDQAFSFILHNKDKYYYFETDRTFDYSSFKKLIGLEFFNIQMTKDIKSLILNEKKLFILDANISFVDTKGILRILENDSFIPFTERYDFYNMTKGETIAVYGGELHLREQDTFYVIKYLKKVHFSVPDSKRGCCECLRK